MADAFNLERFTLAQAPVIDQVREELRAGRKRTHWMWFMFPQLAGLGLSETARHYAIASLDEAQAYLTHPTLGPRLAECTELVLNSDATTAHDIFGTPDDMKFRSCMTLFRAAGPGPFGTALMRYFSGQDDPRTVQLLADAASPPYAETIR